MPKLSISPRRTLPFIALLAVASLAFFPSTFTVAQQPPAPAQQSAAPSQPPASPDQKSDDSQQPTETLKVNVNVVQLFFNVKDKHGALIPNLTKDDFEVY